MNTRKRTWSPGLLVPVLIAGAALSACDGGSTAATGPSDEPQPGLLTLHVTGGAADAYGYVIEVTGPGIDAVQPVSNGETYSSLSGSGLRAAIVLRTPGDGRILRIEVPDVSRVDAYSAVVREVADVQNEPLEPSAYRITVER